MNGLRAILEAIKNALTWWVTIAPWEQAIRVRLGKRVKLLESGVHLRLPVVDKVFKQSVRRRASVLPAQTLVTKDGKPLTIAVMVGYRISDLLLLYNTLHHAESTITSTVMGALGEFVVQRRSDECDIETLSREVSSESDLSRYGIEDVTVTIISFAFVRTYRLITGDGSSWHSGEPLNTSIEERSVPSGPQ